MIAGVLPENLRGGAGRGGAERCGVDTPVHETISGSCDFSERILVVEAHSEGL